MRHRERLPHKMTVVEFQEKFESLTPGQGFKYHSGLLGEDRHYNNDLDRLAELALIMATDLGVDVDPPDERNFCAARIGTGKALLIQRRNGCGFEYMIQKRRSQY